MTIAGGERLRRRGKVGRGGKARVCPTLDDVRDGEPDGVLHTVRPEQLELAILLASWVIKKTLPPPHMRPPELFMNLVLKGCFKKKDLSLGYNSINGGSYLLKHFSCSCLIICDCVEATLSFLRQRLEYTAFALELDRWDL